MVAATSGAIYLLALACPVGMGLMMLFMNKGMMGGNKQDGTSGAARDERPLADLKAEQARLAEKISALEATSEREKAAGSAEPVEETERTPA